MKLNALLKIMDEDVGVEIVTMRTTGLCMRPDLDECWTCEHCNGGSCEFGADISEYTELYWGAAGNMPVKLMDRKVLSIWPDRFTDERRGKTEQDYLIRVMTQD